MTDMQRMPYAMFEDLARESRAILDKRAKENAKAQSSGPRIR